MPTDLHNLARRLVALGCTLSPNMAVTDDSGAVGVVVKQGPRWKDDPMCAPEQEAAIGDRLMVWRPGYGLTATTEWVPDLSDDATLGVLLGAMGWPSVRFSDRIDSMKICHLSSPARPVAAFTSSVREGPTRTHALAAAIVALAESRGGVVP